MSARSKRGTLIPPRLLWDLQPFIELNRPIDHNPSTAKVLIDYFVAAVADGEKPAHRISLYIAQALSRLAAGRNGGTALAHSLGLDRSISGMTKAAAILHTFRENLRLDDQMDQTTDLRIAAAVNAAATSRKGSLAKQLGIQRMQAGNPGAPSKKRRLTPGDREEIPLLFEKQLKAEERLEAEAARPDTRGAKSPRTRVIEALAEEYKVAVRTIENCLKRARDEAQQRHEILNPQEQLVAVTSPAPLADSGGLSATSSAECGSQARLCDEDSNEAPRSAAPCGDFQDWSRKRHDLSRRTRRLVSKAHKAH
jgi:hypothetical protein